MRKLIAFAASLSLVFFVLYPNVYLGFVQIKNEIEGIDSLIDPDNALVKITGDQLMSSGQAPEEWVSENITWKRDYDLYYNLEYWAKPEETLLIMKGDCEDRAILTQSLNQYLQMESEIIVQLDHVYILKDGEEYFGVSETSSIPEMIIDIIKEIPLLRKIIIVAGLSVIWIVTLYIGRQGSVRHRRVN